MSQIVEFKNAMPNPYNPSVKDVPPDEVLELKKDLLIIDVRGKDEYHGELGHIPGSQLMTLGGLPNELNTLPKNKAIVFICRSGARSAQASEFAVSQGYTEVYNMKGGMMLWNQIGLETDK
ncbi:MAG: rhodanese-like domain-containing protein [Bdellovibrionaceae bacterium]|jgi:rhodanese-related sulfurtransferase|nr:rhodanese-like domain-containing protein [Pseudobdellovibrionaceae bacterium]